MKRVAYCLYGQPRLLEEGYKTINKLQMKYKDTHIFDFFFHTWHDDDLVGTYYPCNPYRGIPLSWRLIKKEIVNQIIQLYNPVSYLVEKPKTFDLTSLKQSKTYNSTNQEQQNNFHNVVSNLYSKNQVCNLLTEHINNNNVKYDCIISSRFDIFVEINFDINRVIPNSTKLYCHAKIFNQNSIRDNIIISSYNVFRIYSDTFLNLEEILNDEETMNMLYLIDAGYVLGVERIITGHMLRNYPNFFDVVEFCDDIPNFM